MYELWLTDDTGTRIELLENWQRLEYVITYTPGKAGVIKAELTDIDPSWLQPDRLLYLYRRPEGGRLTLEQAAFLRRWRWEDDGSGELVATLWGIGANELLLRRIVAYYAGSDEAQKTDNADDMAKAVVTENLLTDSDYSGSVTGRAFDSNYLTVQANSSDGPSITKGFSWRKVSRVLADIAEASRGNGTALYYRMTPTPEGAFEFRTHTTRPGLDRRWPDGSNPLLFGVKFGNLSNMSYEVDYTGEENYVYAGGKGDESDRTIATASDTDRINKSAWNRREGFSNASYQQSGAVTAAANERLAEHRPRARFRADFLNTPETPYGGINGWHAGDEVTAVVRDGLHVDCVIEAVHVSVDDDGAEDVRGRAEVAL